MNSALYQGWVRHRRTDKVEHQFQYRVFMTLIDLDETEQLQRAITGLGASRWSPISLRREDHAGPAELPLKAFILGKLRDAQIADAIGSVHLLTNLRWFGHCFNPLSVYYCFAENGSTLRAVVLEVTNTPWGERHCYVIDMARTKGSQKFDKDFHVSPFLDMDMRYSAYLAKPGDVLSLALNNIQSQSIVHRATLVLKRRPLTSANLWRAGLREISMTLRVKWRIHWQALRLFVKGAQFHTHPNRKANH